jgi:uncharacterized protein (TIGR00369 family)
MLALMSERHALQRWVDESPFGPWWGLQVESAGEGLARVRLPYRPELQRLGGVLQGACAMVVADVAMWIAIIAAVDGGERAVTTHLSTDFLAPAGSDIIGTARIIKAGRRLIVGTVETHDSEGALIAIHGVTYALPGGASRGR